MKEGKVALGNLTRIRTGKLDANASSPNGRYPFFTCAINPLRIDTYSYECECVLVAGNGDLNVKYYNGRFDAYQRTYIVEPTSKSLDCRYLYHFLDSYLTELRKLSIGGVIKYIKLGNLTEAQIPLPTLEEQQRIAAILDKANTIASLQQDARSIVGNLPRSLFIDLFGDPRVNPHSWPEYALRELGRVVTGSTPPSSLNGMFNGAIPFVTPGDLGSGFEPRRSLTEEGALRSRIVRRGSALVCCIGTIGKMDIAKQDSAFNQQINAVEWGDAVVGEYGIESLQFLKDAIANSGASTTVPILKKSSFEKLRIPVPPIDLQRDYAERIRAIDPYLIKLQNAARHGASLMQAVAARAFSGELLV